LPLALVPDVLTNAVATEVIVSLSDMADRAALAHGPDAGQPPSERAGVQDLGKALSAIAAYFPVETLAAYMAGMAIIRPGSTAEQWTFYFLFVAFTWVVVLYYAWLKREQSRPGDPLERRDVAWLLIFAGVSFTVWSATTPWTPFLVFTSDAQLYAGFGAILLSFLLPMGAQVLRISPPWRS
jgi:hypothetical protein